MMRRVVKLSVVLAAMMTVLSACNVSTPFNKPGATSTPANSGATAARGSAVTSSAANVQTVQAMPPLAATVVVLASPTPLVPTPVPMTPLPPTKPPASSATLAAMQSMQPAGATTQVVTITADESVNMRSGPATDTDVVTLIPPGTEVAVVEATVKATDNGTPWVKVTINSQTGYVRSDLVGPPHAPTTAGAASPAAMGTAPVAGSASVATRPAAMTAATATP